MPGTASTLVVFQQYFLPMQVISPGVFKIRIRIQILLHVYFWCIHEYSAFIRLSESVCLYVYSIHMYSVTLYSSIFQCISL